jgi:hypothetical protein
MIPVKVDGVELYTLEVTFTAAQFKEPPNEPVRWSDELRWHTLPPLVEQMSDSGPFLKGGVLGHRMSYWISNGYTHDTYRLGDGDWIVYWREPAGYVEVLKPDEFLRRGFKKIE